MDLSPSVIDIQHFRPLKDVSSNDRSNVFASKISFCTNIFESSSSSNAATALKEKHTAMADLVQYISDNKSNTFHPSVVPSFVKMISSNLFNSLKTCNSEPNIDSNKYDPMTKTKQYTYDLLLRFVLFPDLDIKLARKHLNKYFITNLLELFDVEDNRERDCLKTILHRIYARFMSHRTFIRKAMVHIFHDFMYGKDREGGRYRGISELLDILASIINGFAQPLKPEHTILLTQVLLPMFKSPFLSSFHSSLSYCVVQFVEKEAALTSKIIKKLVRWWPQLSSSKLLYTATLEDLVSYLSVREKSTSSSLLVKQICQGVNDDHFQVAERSLLFLGSHYIANIVTEHINSLAPLVFDTLYGTSKRHWNNHITSLATDTLRLYMELEYETFATCAGNYKKRKAVLAKNRMRHEANWEIIENCANLENIEDEVEPISPPTEVLDDVIDDDVHSSDSERRKIKWTGSVSMIDTSAAKVVVAVPEELSVIEERPIEERGKYEFSQTEMQYYLSLIKARNRAEKRELRGRRNSILGKTKSLADLFKYVEEQPEEDVDDTLPTDLSDVSVPSEVKPRKMKGTKGASSSRRKHR
ncbi:hypothetical protein GEMRC1_002890 [Eukaryota sp. GEM-RC1]